MVNKSGGIESASWCPMQQIRNASNDIKKRCHDMFWKPNLKLNNTLWWIDGKELIPFLDIWLKDISTIEKRNDFTEIIPISIIWELWPSDEIDIEILKKKDRQKPNYLSTLSYIIYSDFVLENKNNAKDRQRFYELTHIFFQAFDSVFLTWLLWVNTLKQWEWIKHEMKEILIDLSQIPTGIQSTMSLASIELWYMFGRESPYVINNMKELWDFGESKLWALKKWIDEEEWWYWRCPAAEDGTLMKAFDILFDIYGELIVTPKEEKLLQST